MDALGYLALLRRRWLFVVVPVLLSIGVAVLTAPTAKHTVAVKGYSATNTLLQGPDVTTPPNFDRLQLFATTGEVPIKAKARLHSDLSPAVLASRVQVVSDAKVGSLTLTVSGANGDEDASIANAFGEEVKAFLLEQAQQARTASIVAAQARVDLIAGQIRVVQGQIAAGGNAVLLNAQLQARTQQYSNSFSNLLDLQNSPPATSPLQTLQAASPVPTLTGGFSAPTSKRSRVLIALLLSLVLAIAVIVLVDRLDTRLRSRGVVEDVTRLAVLAEVPLLVRAERRPTTVSVNDAPVSPVAEAYRTLRSSLLNMPTLMRDTSDGSTQESRVVLVTSPGSGDGKTTSVANLAAAAAEAGLSVLVLDCDFRRPKADAFLGVQPSPGLSDAVVAGPESSLLSFVRTTRVSGVYLVTAGSALDHPAALTARLSTLVDQARTMADLVILDSAPLLSVSDASDLVPYVDTVLMVVRAGKTSAESARSAAERLARLGVGSAGVAFVASASKATDGYYTKSSDVGLDAVAAPVEVLRPTPAAVRPQATSDLEPARRVTPPAPEARVVSAPPRASPAPAPVPVPHAVASSVGSRAATRPPVERESP